MYTYTCMYVCMYVYVYVRVPIGNMCVQNIRSDHPSLMLFCEWELSLKMMPDSNLTEFLLQHVDAFFHVLIFEREKAAALTFLWLRGEFCVPKAFWSLYLFIYLVHCSENLFILLSSSRESCDVSLPYLAKPIDSGCVLTFTKWLNITRPFC